MIPVCMRMHEMGGGGLSAMCWSDCFVAAARNAIRSTFSTQSLLLEKKINQENPIQKDLCPVKPFLPALD